MGETLIIKNSADFHLQSNVSVQQGCDHVFCQCIVFMLFLKKLLQNLLVEILLILINVDVTYMVWRHQLDTITIVLEIHSCQSVMAYSVSKESISCILKYLLGKM